MEQNRSVWNTVKVHVYYVQLCMEHNQSILLPVRCTQMRLAVTQVLDKSLSGE
jgi:hypothetical protein